MRHTAAVRMTVASFIVTSVAATLAAQAPAPEPTLPAVLQRTAEYVKAYQTKLAGIVAEEHYRQSVVRIFPPPSQRVTPLPQNRELKSDLLLVRLAGDDRWVQFRDVFEVDRKPIRDRDERLFKLFLEPTSSSRMKADDDFERGVTLQHRTPDADDQRADPRVDLLRIWQPGALRAPACQARRPARRARPGARRATSGPWTIEKPHRAP